MSGTEASNIGYGKIIPNSNVTPNYVNVRSTDYSGGLFTSTVIPGPPHLPGLVAAKNNVDAANGRLPTFYAKGGSNQLKRKIKNITKHYKMPKRSLKKRVSTLRKKIKRHLKGKGKGKSNRSRRQRGGYSQYENNLPNTPTYSTTGTYLKATNSNLASPPVYKVLTSCTNCVDNYNHYTGKGFQSPGH